MLKRQVGQRISTLRREKRLSQERLAEASNYSVVFISCVERGVYAPSLEGCARIAKALNVPLKDLFDFDE